MFRKGVNAAPCGDEKGIEEFLAAAGPFQPYLAYQKNDREDYAITNECAAHDEVSKALTQVIALAEPKSGNATEEHLHPADDGHQLSHNPVSEDGISAHAGVDPFFQMEFEIDTHNDLEEEHRHEGEGEFGVYIGCELPSAVGMTEEVASYRNHDA